MTTVTEEQAAPPTRDLHRIAARAYLELLDTDLPVGNLNLGPICPDLIMITFYARGSEDGAPFADLDAWVKFLGITEYREQNQGARLDRVATGDYKGLRVELRATVFASAPTVVRTVTA